MDETELAETVTSCEYLVDLAKVLEEDSEECSMYLQGESSCCSVQVENPCTMCAGATIDTSISIPDIGDCNTVVEIASATMSADNPDCPFFQLFEAACCPTPATNPCSICPEGYTFNGGAYIMGEGGPTCSDLETNTEEGSPACSSAKDIAEGLISSCCVQAGAIVPDPMNNSNVPTATIATLSPSVPSPAPSSDSDNAVDDPCTICPDGPTVSEGDAFYDQCEEIIAGSDLYAIYDTNSEFCPKSSYEAMCCPTPPENPCIFCPDGIATTIELDYCNMQKTSLAFFPADDEIFCTAEIVKNLESSCCPGQIEPPENPCQFCPEGIDVEGSPMAGFFGEAELVEMIASCEYYVGLATVLEKDSEECSMYLPMESSCCSPIPHENPCQFCPGGIDVEGSPIGSFMNETELAETVTSCEYYVESAKVLEKDSEECSMYLPMESSCCSPTPHENPCQFCPGGIDVEGSPMVSLFGEAELVETELAEMVTLCEYYVESAKVLEADSEECSMYLQGELSCCSPTPHENPCQFCPGGIDVEGSPIASFMNETMLAETVAGCGYVVDMVKAFEADSEECSLYSMSESSCCPGQIEPPENPCPFCPGGISLEGSPMAGLFGEAELAEAVAGCELYVELAKVLEEDSELCSVYLEGESSCCPGQIENPCTVCAGATVDTSVTLFPDMGDCNAVIGLASATMSADNPDCAFFQMLGSVCCPTPATIPCSICPEGYTINRGAYVMDEGGPTCSDVVTNTEEDSPGCSSAKDEADGLISTCCVQAGAIVPDPMNNSNVPTATIATLSPVASPAPSSDSDDAVGKVEVPMPSPGNATGDLPPVNDTTVDPGNATLSPVASPVNNTTVPADNATLSPVASPPAEEVPSPVPTDGPPTSAASSLLTSNVVMSPMPGLLFVFAGFLLA